MKRWLLAVGNWFDARLRLRATLLPMMRHPIPREVAGPMGWWYVFGSASLTLLLVQILTGIVLVLVHATQVFLHGAYKYPRELTWVMGVFLLLSTLGMFFTGQVLRWDPDAYWGVGVGAAMAGRVPEVGPSIVDIMLGGPIIGGDTLSRFF